MLFGRQLVGWWEWSDDLFTFKIRQWGPKVAKYQGKQGRGAQTWTLARTRAYGANELHLMPSMLLKWTTTVSHRRNQSARWRAITNGLMEAQDLPMFHRKLSHLPPAGKVPYSAPFCQHINPPTRKLCHMKKWPQGPEAGQMPIHYKVESSQSEWAILRWESYIVWGDDLGWLYSKSHHATNQDLINTPDKSGVWGEDVHGGAKGVEVLIRQSKVPWSLSPPHPPSHPKHLIYQEVSQLFSPPKWPGWSHATWKRSSHTAPTCSTTNLDPI